MSTLELENIKHPDNSGNNLTLAADGSVSKIHVKSGDAGSVSASPQADDLVVEASTEAGITIISPDDQSARIRFTSPSTDAGDVGGATVFYRQNINKMSIGTEVAGGQLALKSGAGAENLKINALGYVTTPNQPAFSIESSYSYSSTGTGEQVFNSSTVYYNNTNIRANVGAHWSSSTGRFTAPVAGSYSFTFNVDVKNHNSGYLLIRIRKNGSQMVGIYPDQTSAKERVTLNTILTLAAGDYMDVSWNNNYATPIFSYASFSGFLIG